MPDTPLSPDEAERLAALRALELLDTAPEPEFDDLVRLASRLCDTPVSLINLIDADRLWCKAGVGLAVQEIPRNDSFCAHAILQKELFIVPDLAADARFAAHPLVADEPRLRFYAGVPLLEPEGHPIGTLCVADHRPRTLDLDQREALAALGRQARLLLTLRRRNAEYDRALRQSIETAVTLRQSEARYRRIIETAREGVWIIDAQNRTTFVNLQMAEMLGYTPEEMAGRSLFDFMDDQSRAVATVNVERRRQGIAEQHDFRFRHKDGGEIWTLMETTPLFSDDGRYEGALAMVTDISIRRRAEEALRESEERFRQIADNTRDVFWIATTTSHRVLYVSPAYETLWGRSSAALYENPLEWLEVIHPDDRDRVVGEFDRFVRSQTPYDTDYRVVRPDGSVLHIHDRGTVVRNAEGEPIRVAGIASDITERKQLEERLKTLAQRDLLTGLPNRGLFFDRLRQELARAHRNHGSVAVLFLDLDAFKDINDKYGHETGDLLLAAIGQRLMQYVRETDTVARFGGDEFTVIFTEVTDEATVLELARKLLSTLAAPYVIDRLNLAVTVCCGISLYPKDGDDPVTLVRLADRAMYQTKRLGSNNVAFYLPE